jgi:G3E family GTPase
LRIVETDYCDVPLEVLLSVGRFDPARANFDGHEDEHANLFASWSYQSSHPVSLDAVREIARKLPGNIYRAKGVIYSSDAPQRRAVMQVVGRRVDISIEDEWGERAPRTQIVAIGAAGSFSPGQLEDAFASL